MMVNCKIHQPQQQHVRPSTFPSSARCFAARTRLNMSIRHRPVQVQPQPQPCGKKPSLRGRGRGLPLLPYPVLMSGSSDRSRVWTSPCYLLLVTIRTEESSALQRGETRCDEITFLLFQDLKHVAHLGLDTLSFREKEIAKRKKIKNYRHKP